MHLVRCSLLNSFQVAKTMRGPAAELRHPRSRALGPRDIDSLISKPSSLGVMARADWRPAGGKRTDAYRPVGAH